MQNKTNLCKSMHPKKRTMRMIAIYITLTMIVSVGLSSYLLLPGFRMSPEQKLELHREARDWHGGKMYHIKEKMTIEDVRDNCKTNSLNLPIDIACAHTGEISFSSQIPQKSFRIIEPMGVHEEIDEEMPQDATSENEELKNNPVSFENIHFTSYNPERGQTDNSPCIGAAGTDLCRFVKDEEYRMELIGTKEYIEPIALSQELVGRAEWKPFHYYDIVTMTSEDGDDRCNKKAVVLDTMNARFRKRGDLFFNSRIHNTSCRATVTKL